MKYLNAKDILPALLVKELQGYIQGGYIYIPANCVLSTRIPKNQKENSLFSEAEFPSFGRTLLVV